MAWAPIAQSDNSNADSAQWRRWIACPIEPLSVRLGMRRVCLCWIRSFECVYFLLLPIWGTYWFLPCLIASVFAFEGGSAPGPMRISAIDASHIPYENYLVLILKKYRVCNDLVARFFPHSARNRVLSRWARHIKVVELSLNFVKFPLSSRLILLCRS